MTVADLYAKLSLKTDEGSFDFAERALHKIKHLLIEFAAFETVKLAGEMVKSTAEVGAHFVEMAEQVGIGIEPLQQLGFVAGQSGSSVDELAIGLRKLSVTAASAKRGNKEAAATLKGLGVDAGKLANGSLTLDGALMQISDRFKSMPDGAKKLALSTEAFGRSGSKLIPMLNRGSEELGAMRQEFIDLGGQIDEHTAREMKGFGDETYKIGVIFQGLKNTIVKAVLPAILKLTKAFVEWFKLHREEITRKLEHAMYLLVEAMKAVGRALSWLSDMLTNLGDAFKAVAIAVAAIGLVMMAPFLLTTAIVAGLILIVQDLWTWFNGGNSVFKQLYGYMVDGLADTITKWMSKIEGFVTWAQEQKDKLLGKNQNKLLFDQPAIQALNGGRRVVGQTARDRAKSDQAGDDEASTHFGKGAIGWFPVVAALNGLNSVLHRHESRVIPGRLVDQAKAFNAAAARDVTVNVTVPPGMATKEGAHFIGAAIREHLEGLSRDVAAAGGAP